MKINSGFSTLRLVFLVLSLSGIINLLHSQKLQTSSEQECIICHTDWAKKASDRESFLQHPELENPTGLKYFYPTDEKMCYSCHDGYVTDSRDFFLEKDSHKKRPELKNYTAFELPVDETGHLYCGTCHSPHADKTGEMKTYAPFLRFSVKHSELCLKCHRDYATMGESHPLHVETEKIPQVLKNAKTDTSRVECLTCHRMHRRAQTKLTINHNRGALCRSCHKDYFAIEKSDHDFRDNLAKIREDTTQDVKFNDQCSACHNIHHGSGRWMWTSKTILTGLDSTSTLSDSLNRYCLRCHSADGIAAKKQTHFDAHPVTGKIKKCDREVLLKVSRKELTCLTCHDAHKWSPERKITLTQANEEGNAQNSFLRIPDDHKGDLCLACHSKQESLLSSDHAMLGIGFQDYLGEQWKQSGQCTICHEMHKKGFKGQFSPGSDSALVLCTNCHENKKAKITRISTRGHPLHISFPANVHLSGFRRGDSTLINCLTCHDPHLWSKTGIKATIKNAAGDERNSFLIIPNAPNGALCLLCHEDRGAISNSKHDLTLLDSSKTHSSCSYCHSVHKAKTDFARLGAYSGTGATLGQKHCLTCHTKDGSASKAIPKAFEHPVEYGIVSPLLRKINDWYSFPLFLKEEPADTVGHIDCLSCHDPHYENYLVDKNKPVAAHISSPHLQLFLRNPSYNTLCRDCHGENALWKFQYFHDPEKRKRY